MGSAHCAHEIDDRHHHESGRNRPHARSYGPAASSSDDFATGSNHDQQEHAPGFCEDAPPLKGIVQEVDWQLPLSYVCLVSKRFHFIGSRPKGVGSGHPPSPT
jgi:hypothetical protein